LSRWRGRGPAGYVACPTLCAVPNRTPQLPGRKLGLYETTIYLVGTDAMPLTQFESALRPLARDRISKGRLPRKVRPPLWGGNGTGQLCALCDKTIPPSEVELEVEALVNGTLRTLRFHVLCESAWQLECARDDYLKPHL